MSPGMLIEKTAAGFKVLSIARRQFDLLVSRQTFRVRNHLCGRGRSSGLFRMMWRILRGNACGCCWLSVLGRYGKFVVPTSAGLQIFELLRGAAPSLVDPATTATWEMQLDDIVSGRTDFRVVIDGIASMAGQLIEGLRGTPASAVDLSPAAAAAVRGRRPTPATARRRS